jgi:hypothetical protein
VSESEWFYDGVARVTELGLMSGMDKGFEPGVVLSRAMFATILFNLAKPADEAGKANFTDVPPGQWYSDPVTWAASVGIASGVGNGKFEPSRSITREEMMAILFRFAKLQEKAPYEQPDASLAYPDNGEVSYWAQESVVWATANGIVSGEPINGAIHINPKGAATRAQAATIITRYIDSIE